MAQQPVASAAVAPADPQALAAQIANNLAERHYNPVHLSAENVTNFPYASYELSLSETRSFQSFGTEYAQEFSYLARVKHVEPDTFLGALLPSLSLVFESLLNELRDQYEEHDLVRVFIQHETLTACNIIVGPEYLRDMTSQLIIQQVARTVRSNNFIPADRQLRINLAAVRNLSGKSFFCVNNVWKDLKRKRSIISIANQDHLCLPRAIAVGLAHYEHKAHPHNRLKKSRYKTMRNGDRNMTAHNRRSLQKRTALKYVQMAGLHSGREGLLQDVPRYEKALKVGITVVSSAAQNRRIHSGNSFYERQIVLYHVMDTMGCGNGHFAVVTKMTGLLCRSYYCESCDVGYSNVQKHHCERHCNRCGSDNCEKGGKFFYCSSCHCPCRNEDCLLRHRNQKDLCDSMTFCPKCHVCLRGLGRRYRPTRDHVCGESYCVNCGTYVLQDHLCYMRATVDPKEDDKTRYLFYDFECMQEGESDHIPNLVVCHSICKRCESETHVGPDSICLSCGSRCRDCDARLDQEFVRDPCAHCAKREVVFSGSNTAYMFCSWLFSPQHEGCTVIAHNAKAYDAYFLYSYLINAALKPNIVFNGTKIMYCYVGKRLRIKLLDSVNFLPMPLAQLPSSFGLTESQKGFFPHFFNTFDAPQTRLSHLPDPHFYGVDTMTASRRKAFFEWYEENRECDFDLHRDLLIYCRSDVDVLMNACWKFRQLLLDITQNRVNPFAAFVTIAAVALGTFRSCFLEEHWRVLTREDAREGCNHDSLSCCCNWAPAVQKGGGRMYEFEYEPGRWCELNPAAFVNTFFKREFVSSPIGLLPPQGYARRDTFSQQCMQWLHIYERRHQIKVQSASSIEGEKRVYYYSQHRRLHFSLDGYYVDDGGVQHALEFNGCYFHGCPECYPRDRNVTRVGNKTLSRRFQDTLARQDKLREMGFRVESIWSCEFARRLKSCPQWAQWSKEVVFQEPIDLRDCYYGGRTNALVLDYVGKAHLVDFCSLYPSQMKYKPYPCGHPRRLARDIPGPRVRACDVTPCPLLGNSCPGQHVILPYFGVVKAKVVAPRRLYHPVLPVRCNGKLMFPLCFTCALKDSRDYCSCLEDERAFVGTWCTPELETALSVGYGLMEVYEVLEWSETSQSLFVPFVNEFVRVKAEASGWPSYVTSDADKDRYIEHFHATEGVWLSRDKIEKNPGLRTLAKLLLNSLYGKFAQRQNLKKCKFVTCSSDLYNMLSDTSKNVKDFHVLTPNIMLIEYGQAKEFEGVDPKTNVVISAFCACYGRLELWKVMHWLGKRVLYHDTDSVIYTPLLAGEEEQEVHPPTGECLGQLTDELSCKNVGCSGCQRGHWIVDFVSCGPKNYAYRLNTGETVCKVRGFSLNYQASQVINLNSMRESLYAWKKDRDGVSSSSSSSGGLVTVSAQILRNKQGAKVYTRNVEKKYSVVYNKRFVKDDFTTRPFGYCEKQ